MAALATVLAVSVTQPANAALSSKASNKESSNPSSNLNLASARSVATDKVANFWTAQRIDSALTREFVFDKDAKSARLNAVRKGGGSGGTTTKGPNKATTTSTGKSWTSGGLPLAATGKVFFTFGSSTYVCSGSVVTDDKTDRSIVLTAGHCVYNQGTSQFASNWIFIPAYDSKPNGSCTDPTNAFPYGCWTARSLMVHSDFSTQTTFNAISTQSDWAFAVIGANSAGAHLDTTVGSFVFNESGFTATNQAAYSFGYPAASPYAGADLVFCNGNTFADANNASATWGLACNMTGGASGGPWMSAFSTSTNSGALSSVNSYKYSNDATKMYGPKFDSRTRSTLNAALSVS
jgi:V8-like Glu-specific endopeptidase